ncbi:hypothetical protein [Natranaerofaba carboxydovora]|uniref:hypothetical protein n=1 Tax=Natranaerofaba carboxydovora TaxID=2742683 RepID=UPI001F12D364|nr:hypothetical protein [Natranaerofaba carboxydovora]UMZ75016.1 hypothetical protein ACONDI_02624 [Natranaerofaba carboxydovora]
MFKLFHGEKSRFQHFCALGEKQTGKSTLLGNMALNDIERGDGVLLIDTQGGLANVLIERIKTRRRDIFYLDCTHKFYPMGFNIFELQSQTDEEKELEKELIEDYFYDFLESLLGKELLENQNLKDYVIKLTRTALMISLNTKDVITALHSFEMTPVIEKRIEKLSEELKGFWKKEVELLKEEIPEETRDKVKEKLAPFLESGLVSKITEESVSTFNLFNLVKKGKVVIINIPEEEVGELALRTLLDIVLLKLKVAVRIRNRSEYKKLPLYLYLNEYPSYESDIKDNIINEWLKEGEENMISLNMTQQSRGIFYRYPNIVEYCRVLALFRLQEDDANYICNNHFQEAHVEPEDLTSLDVAQVVLYILNENDDRIVLQATTTPIPQVKELHNYQSILERSIQARSRGLIELARSFR